jgi:aerobic carbon-monoxide dehydrogenase medium subunit
MKPAPFKYMRPKNLAEAVSMLADHGEEASVLAGGQSLMPVMNFRMATPRYLIDIFNLAELKSYHSAGKSLRIGATNTQSALLAKTDDRADLIRAVVANIAHAAVRNRGTVGGSLCFNDPAAEWPALSHALDTSLTLRSVREVRAMRPGDFQTGPITTSIEPDEILTDIHIPELPRRWGFSEIARRSGDFALAGAIVAEFSTGWRAVLFGVGSGSQRLSEVERLLDAGGSREGIKDIVRVEAEVTADDVYGTAAYRRHLAAGIVDKVVKQACNSI